MYIIKYKETCDKYLTETIHEVFVTESKEKAQNYIDKFNSRLEYWHDQFSNLDTNYDRDRLYYIDRINYAYFDEIELR